MSLLGLMADAIVHRGTIFYKVAEISNSNSEWLITLVIDFNPYRQFMDKLSESITRTSSMAAILKSNLEREHTSPSVNAFINNFISLSKEIQQVNNSHSEILESFADMHESDERFKRSLFPWGGSLLHSIFGVVTDDNIDRIRNNIHKLRNNQLKLLHAVQHSLSIINMSRVDISENRHTINALTTALDKMSIKIASVAEALELRIRNLEKFTHAYLTLDLMVQDLKGLVQKANFHLQDLKVQLATLSSRHLNPSVITPKYLKKLLLDVKSRLPRHLDLPDDPTKNLWTFYGNLKCDTVMEGMDKILVLISLPLREVHTRFDLFKIYQIPIPANFTIKSPEPRSTQTQWATTYDVNQEALLITQDKAQYAVLSDKDIDQCRSGLHVCKLHSAIYPVATAKSCITALYFRDDNKIDEYCQQVVHLQSVLPQAYYIMDGLWVIATNEPLKINIACGQQDRIGQTTNVNPPAQLIKLEMGCHAFNRQLKLPAFYKKQSRYVTPQTEIQMNEIFNVTLHSLWKPLVDKFPNISQVTLPPKLQDIKQVPMTKLMQSLREVEMANIVTEKRWPTWYYVIFGFALTLTAGVTLFLYCKYCTNMRACKAKRGDRRGRKSGVAIGYNAANDTITSSAPEYLSLATDNKQGNLNLMERLYPMLDKTTQ